MGEVKITHYSNTVILISFQNLTTYLFLDLQLAPERMPLTIKSPVTIALLRFVLLLYVAGPAMVPLLWLLLLSPDGPSLSSISKNGLHVYQGTPLKLGTLPADVIIRDASMTDYILHAECKTPPTDMTNPLLSVVEDGYEFFAKRQLVTLFSAPNYCGEFDNAGGMMSVDETLMCSFQ
eukprot:g39800.t1